MWNKCNVSLVDIFVSDETFFFYVVIYWKLDNQLSLFRIELRVIVLLICKSIELIDFKQKIYKLTTDEKIEEKKIRMRSAYGTFL